MIESNENLRIHSRLSSSRANGPGIRAVIWLQGCPLRCKGCFNEELRYPDRGIDISINELYRWFVSISGITGVTLSGGEPTEQIPAILPLLLQIRNATDLSTLLFSGRTIEEIRSLPEGNRLVSLLDVLIDGAYEPEMKNLPGSWPSTANQRIHLLTKRYTLNDFSQLPSQEVIITEKGDIIESGILV